MRFRPENKAPVGKNEEALTPECASLKSLPKANPHASLPVSDPSVYVGVSRVTLMQRSAKIFYMGGPCHTGLADIVYL